MFNRIRIGTGGASARLSRLTAVVSALLVACPSASRAAGIDDAVMEWNQIALAATVTAGQGPLPQSRSMTIVQVAVHDAVNAITRTHWTYLSHGPTPAGAAPDAAAIAAAQPCPRHVVSTASRRRWTRRAPRRCAARGLTEADPGIGRGETVAAGILAARANDGASAGAVRLHRAWRRHTRRMGRSARRRRCCLAGAAVTPWVLESGSQFRPDGPPALDSERYARDYQRDPGDRVPHQSTRTTEQTEIARFWLASPSAIWNGVARQAIDAYEPRPVGHRPGVRAHVSGRSRRGHRVLGREIPLQLLAAASRRSSMAISMATTRPSAIGAGGRCFRRRHIPNTSPATRPTAARWRPCCAAASATTRRSDRGAVRRIRASRASGRPSAKASTKSSRRGSIPAFTSGQPTTTARGSVARSPGSSSPTRCAERVKGRGGRKSRRRTLRLPGDALDQAVEQDDVGVAFADRCEDRPAVGRPRDASGDENRRDRRNR